MSLQALSGSKSSRTLPSPRPSTSSSISLPQIKPPSASNGIPNVTAANWAIHDGNTGRLLWQKGGEEQREMASLTKMMTLLVCNNLIQQYDVDPTKMIFTVDMSAASIVGTHSGLKEGEMIRVIDLFYGMMLPSGNDAALTLAFGFGRLILEKRNKPLQGGLGSYFAEFIKEMNKLAGSLGLKSTKFNNPHGLSNKKNLSTVADLGRIAFTALKFPLIQKIVSTQRYTAVVLTKESIEREIIWRNTNKLLEKGFTGMKTGVTPNAGPCLSSLLRRNGESVIITLLNSKTMDHRWSETEELANWALDNMFMIKGSLGSSGSKKRLTPLIFANLYNRS